MAHTLRKIIWKFCIKINTALSYDYMIPFDPEVLFVVFTQKKLKHMSTRICIQMFIAVLFVVAPN